MVEAIIYKLITTNRAGGRNISAELTRPRVARAEPSVHSDRALLWAA